MSETEYKFTDGGFMHGIEPHQEPPGPWQRIKESLASFARLQRISFRMQRMAWRRLLPDRARKTLPPPEGSHPSMLCRCYEGGSELPQLSAGIGIAHRPDCKWLALMCKECSGTGWCPGCGGDGTEPGCGADDDHDPTGGRPGCGGGLPRCGAAGCPACTLPG